VQPERLEKAYHRLWHGSHGRFYAKMRDEDFERSSLRCLGVPVHVYRALIAELARWTASAIARPEAETFEHETRVRFLSGFIFQRCRDTFWSSREKPAAQLPVSEHQPHGAVDSIVGS
jgi:hypothetical protein